MGGQTTTWLFEKDLEEIRKKHPDEDIKQLCEIGLLGEKVVT